MKTQKTKENQSPEKVRRHLHFYPLIIVSLCISFITHKVADAQNLLCDHSFDSVVNNGGQFPYSGCWIDNHIGQAGAVVDGIHFVTSPFSLHVYTGSNANDSLSRPEHTSVWITPGYSCQAEAKIWTPAGYAWQPGSSARVRVQFLNSVNQVISYFDSPLYQTANSSPSIYQVNCDVPTGSTQVRFSILLTKPNVTNQSIINVDECSLTRTILTPKFGIEPPFISYGAFNDTVYLKIENTGGGSIDYHVLPALVPWITIPQLTGILNSGGHKYIPAITNRNALPSDPCNQLFTAVRIAYNITDTVTIPVNINTPCGIPDLPSIVTLSGSQLVVQKRLSCGILAPPKPYTIKGFCWSPASVETTGSYSSRRQAFQRWAPYDLGMIKGCQGNTIYTFLDFGLISNAYKSLLDSIYENGLMAIITVDLDGNFDTANLRSVVNAYKNHPAVLMWAVGNEWNINLYHNHFATVQEAALGTETAAQIIKSIDTLHPIASIYGDISIANQTPNTYSIVNTLCPSVDIWGLNIYRGLEFYDLFTTWATITSKPMFLSEFGIDSFHTTQWNPLPPVGYVNELEQRIWDDSLWLDIVPEISAKNSLKQCLGGTYFEFSDEYWKVTPSGIQNTGGFYTYWNPSAFPDSFSNEEYFGIVGIDSNIRIPKQCFAQISKDFHDTLVAGFIACDTSVCVNDLIEIHFFDLSSGTPTSWLWNFGDGTTSTLPNPRHTYLAAGSYTVTLNVYDSIFSSVLQKPNYVNVQVSCGFTISGIYTYNNTVDTPLDSLRVYLNLNGNKVDSTRTNLPGQYSFTGKAPATYTISATTHKPWAGVNGTDAVKIQRHFAGLEYLTIPVRLLAADVNLSNSINGTDAVKVKRRFSGLDTTFARGDWTFAKPTGGDTVIVNGTSVTQDFQGLCVGDVNGSNIPAPGDFMPVRVTMENSGILEVRPGQEFEFPIRVKHDMNVSAISLVIPYPAEYLSIQSILFNPVNPVYNVAKGELRFAWSELQTLNLKAGETLLTLKLRAKESFTGNQTIELHPTHESELADDAGELIALAELTGYIIKPLKPIGIEDQKSILTQTKIFPNPTSDLLDVEIELAKAAITDVELTDMLGKTRTKLTIGKLKEGISKFQISTSDLPNGVFYIKLLFDFENGHSQYLHKVVIRR